MSRSAIFTANTSTYAYTDGDTLPLGSIIRRFGCSVDLIGNRIALKDAGYYMVTVSVTAEPTAAGSVTVAALYNGTEIAGATVSGTGTAGDPIALTFPAIVRVPCGCDAGAISVTISGAVGTVTNTAVTVERL